MLGKERYALSVSSLTPSLSFCLQVSITEILSLWNISIQPGDSKHFKKWETALMVKLAGVQISPTVLAVWRDGSMEGRSQA